MLGRHLPRIMAHYPIPRIHRILGLSRVSLPYPRRMIIKYLIVAILLVLLFNGGYFFRFVDWIDVHIRNLLYRLLK